MANKLIVSDAGPLISMMKIARLDLLHEMFGEVVVPRTVYNEVTTAETDGEACDGRAVYAGVR